MIKIKLTQKHLDKIKEKGLDSNKLLNEANEYLKQHPDKYKDANRFFHKWIDRTNATKPQQTTMLQNIIRKIKENG